ncbi:hypothetical protein EJ08DRAFT_231807 [Tothia fuscella]|uniref:Uncharacterized protein n=1 Tax=Tothia fuscella TaxID=1048955 RepID=A0A9P4P107_9PEZI|nr:hypothetical protein EJ08DRAFT_231807 [Tothia fuscella]
MTMSEHFIKMPTNSDETLLPFDNASIRARARHEKKRTQSKLCHQRRLCETFMQPFDNLIQMMISYSTAQITERLDRGRQVAEQLGKIGIVVAVITGFVAPLSLITGYYGMNVKEFTPEADLSLFDVWQIGTPIILVSVVGVTVLGLWILTGQKRLPTGTITG